MATPEWLKRILRPKPAMRVFFQYPATKGDWAIPVRASSDAEAVALLQQSLGVPLEPASLVEADRVLYGVRDTAGRFFVMRFICSRLEVLQVVDELHLHDLVQIPTPGGSK